MSFLTEKLRAELKKESVIMYIGNVNQFNIDFDGEKHNFIYEKKSNMQFVWNSENNIKHNIYIRDVINDLDALSLKGFTVDVVIFKKNLSKFQKDIFLTLHSYNKKIIIEDWDS